jgi:hypothetical protein
MNKHVFAKCAERNLCSKQETAVRGLSQQVEMMALAVRSFGCTQTGISAATFRHFVLGSVY